MKLYNIIDNYGRYRYQEAPDQGFRRRVLVYVSIALAFILLIAIPIRHFSSPLPTKSWIASLFVFFIFAITPLFARRFSNIQIASAPALLGISLLVLCSGLFNGGLRAPVVALLPLLPLLCCFFGGIRFGILGIGLNLFILYALYMLEGSVWMDALNDPSNFGRNECIVLSFVSMASYLFGVFYETSRKAAERRLLESAKLASLGAMAGNVCHEINNPLTVIIINSKILTSQVETKTFSSQDVIERCDRISQTANRIANIVHSLQLYAGNESEDAKESVDLKSIIDSSLLLCGQSFKTKEVYVKQNSVPADLYIKANRSQVSQVLLSLFANAFEAATTSKEKWIEIFAKKAGDSVQLTITDSGPGIPKHLQEKLFTPFFTTKPTGNGIGLGLSTCTRIMQGHNGDLRFDPQSPHTRFVLHFPLV